MNNNKNANLKVNKRVFLVFSLLTISPNVFAYLDPGTGAMIIQAIIAMFIGAGIFFNHIKLKVLDIYRSLLQKVKGKEIEQEKIEDKQTKE